MNIAEVIKNFCEDCGYTFYSDYSGRCMYGRRCVGIVCDNAMDTLVQLCDTIRDSSEYESAYDELGSPHVDSLGLETILYFPYVD